MKGTGGPERKNSQQHSHFWSSPLCDLISLRLFKRQFGPSVPIYCVSFGERGALAPIPFNEAQVTAI